VRVVGLTGGIGSGKSTVARLLAERGAIVIDADQVAREIVEPGEPALAEIAAHFGAEVLTEDGALDRPALAAIVFNDADARRDLEAITHPRIGDRIVARLAEIRLGERSDGASRVVVLDHPLLVETGTTQACDDVIVVTAPEEVRVQRLVDQRGMDESDARARIAAQADDATRVAAATHVIDNSGGVSELQVALERLAAELGLDER
jgi:dephospho-CoA kinase